LSDIGCAGRRAILVFYNGGVSSEIAVLSLVSSVVDVPVYAIVSGVTGSTATRVKAWVGKAVTVITDPLAAVLRAQYYVGEVAGRSGITFLVDEAGTIVYRRYSRPTWLMYDDFSAVKLFAQRGEASTSLDRQYVLSLGEVAPMPEFALIDAEGNDVSLADELPMLIYCGISPQSDKGALIFEQLETLRGEYPQVSFLWFVSYQSDEYLSSIWSLYHATELPELNAVGYFDLPLEEYMEKILAERAVLREADHEEIREFVGESWTIVFDLGERLVASWCLVGYPSVIVLDEDGVVRLPFTFYPTNSAGGKLRVHPEAENAIRNILDEIANG
jgi:hypothetical protein